MSRVSQDERTRRFRALHEREGAFLIPNPWDRGSARILAGLGFEALATTSSGFAFTLGRADGAVSRDEVMAHIRDLVSVTSLPVSADLENCFADDPKDAAEAIRLACEAGASGGSIEDYSGPPDGRVYDFNLAVERVTAAVEMAHSLDQDFVLTARAEGLLRGGGDLDDVIGRLQAFEKAGADVLYAPSLKTQEDVRAVCSSVSKPVNVLATPSLTVSEIADAGGKRISTGGELARTTVGRLIEVGQEMQGQGRFASFSGSPSSRDVVTLMSRED